MAYEVIARKYRPQTFEDVVGQDHVVATLRNAIEQERIAHAYLFVGPRGTGKTSSARIFAKALNCEKGPTPTPCNTCDRCVEISEGRSLDVMEIDGASNNGVEQVRELRESVHFMPASGTRKVYIIDEVHMLSIAAFNALLRTLEEPPSHVVFLFATTEAHKVPATILSRCQRFDLRRIGTRDIVGRLRYVCEQEEIEAEDAALVALARGADGGMRDAQSALDQLIAFKGKSLQENDVLSVFVMVSHALMADLGEALLSGDVAGAVRAVNEFDRTGKDLQRILFDLLDHMRSVAVYGYTQDDSLLSETTDEHASAIKAQAALLPPAWVSEILDLLVQAEGRIKHSLSRKTAMELALIRCARASQHVAIDEIVRDLQELRASLGDEAQVEKKK